MKLSDQIIDGVEDFKYLGIHLDPKLSFTNHVVYVKEKCTSRMRMLGKTRKMVSQETSLQLYWSLMVPLLDYGNVYDCL